MDNREDSLLRTNDIFHFSHIMPYMLMLLNKNERKSVKMPRKILDPHFWHMLY